MELIDMKNIFLGGWIMHNRPTSSLFPHFPMILSLSPLKLKDWNVNKIKFWTYFDILRTSYQTNQNKSSSLNSNQLNVKWSIFFKKNRVIKKKKRKTLWLIIATYNGFCLPSILHFHLFLIFLSSHIVSCVWLSILQNRTIIVVKNNNQKNKNQN
jgi:hypothetical protein